MPARQYLLDYDRIDIVAICEICQRRNYEFDTETSAWTEKRPIYRLILNGYMVSTPLCETCLDGLSKQISKISHTTAERN